MDEKKKITESTPLLKQAFLAVQQMQAKLDGAERRAKEPIAIVGLGCRFPGGVVDGESFWKLLREGRDAISLIPNDRWDADAYYDPDPDRPGKMVTRWGGFLDRVDGFDARFFEIAPREAASMDPQQRLALEVAWETLENTGYAPASLQGTKTGVFLGIASNDYSQLHLGIGDAKLLDAHYASGVAHSIASGRISYLLGLEGPSVSLDTACSSSLVAVHLACQSLRSGDCTLALAGGVNIMLAPETTALLSRVRMLSPEGRCKAFDDSADGFVRGEGCGFVALKKLSQAQADGDRILAVIRGSAVNQDGASSSLTAPNGPSQMNLMRQALTNADMSPGEITYVEAHGTGTALGDPIELQALGAVYGAARPAAEPLMVGSLKTNVGHLEAAAGVAGLIKTVLALEHGKIPPHLHLQKPTSHISWQQLGLTVPTKLVEWKPLHGHRYAGVSSFGFSGTNAHVVVAEASGSNAARSETGWPLQILTASARSKAALQTVVGRYREFLEQHAETDLRDFCFTANTGRSHFPHRACFLAANRGTMQQQLAAWEASASPKLNQAGGICYLFTGQGSQYGGMGRELYESSPVFREALERSAAAWRQETGESLIEAMYGAEGESKMHAARYAQPALFALEVGLAELWRSWGVEPSVLLGHSLGEYAAAVVAGVFGLEDGMRLVCARARLMDRLQQPGAMRAIAASPERVARAIAGQEKEVSIAAINGRESVVISGAAEAVGKIAEKLEGEGIRTQGLAVTHGFHSPLLEPILEEFEECARKIEYHAPRIRMISNLSGEAATAEEVARPEYWRRHMRSTVLFHSGLQAALASGCHTFLEIGPQPHLSSLGKSAHSNSDFFWLPSIRKRRNPWLDILSTVGTLYGLGADIDWKALHGKSGRSIALPTYPFERQRYWFARKPATGTPAKAEPSAQQHPLLGSRLHSPLAEIQFTSRIAPGQPAYLGDHIVAGQRMIPASAYLEMALSAANEIGLAHNSAGLESVAFLHPCIFDEPRILQCVVQNKAVRHSFAIYSTAEDNSSISQKKWTLHATGEMIRKAVQAADAARREDLDIIRTRCTEPSDASTFYRAFEEQGACFGANFRSVARVFHGQNEALVELEVCEEAKTDADRYTIHPVALDACFQAAVALLLTHAHWDGTLYLPVTLDELRILGDPRNLSFAHARIQQEKFAASSAAIAVDVGGYDFAGNLLVSAKGLMFRAVPRQARPEPAADSISNLLYEVEWAPVGNGQKPEKSGHGIAGTCVLAGGSEEFVASLSKALKKNGVSCAVIPAASTGLQQEQHRYDALLQKIEASASFPISDCIFIAPLKVDDVFRLPPDRALEMAARMLGECLEIVQALLRMELKKTPRLWIITCGAQGPGLSNVLCSTLWGFGRSVAAEYPEMRVVQIDLDPSREPHGEDLMQCMDAARTEDQLALRGQQLYAPRLRRIAPPAREAGSIAEKSNVRLTLIQSGTLEGIENIAASRRDPGPGEVEIRVHAAGLNFRDVLNVLGMYPGKSGPLGGECAGTVVRVGAGVTSLQPGDAVVALGQGCFASFVTTSASMAWPKPANLSFAVAVTIPIAFLTASYALESMAQIRSGDRVLIHAGAGGVGLAAIQIAQKAGAIVFATAGSPEKRAYLASIGVAYVMDSRSLNFAHEIREITEGRGVDVILNSLIGPFIDAGLEALTPGGRFVELGVADLRSTASVARVRPDVTYHPFNLAPALEAGDSFVREMLTSVFDQLQAGILHPLPREIFPMEKAQDAFRYMAQARHIGRVVICPEPENDGGRIRRDGAYLVTGGLSGLGLAVAEWLAERRAGQVIVMGRRSANSEAEEVFRKMREAGTMVSVCPGDVTKKNDVQSALDCARTFPLRGVVHCAGVLDDGALLQQSRDHFRRVLAPKLEGACHLHQLTADLPLDHFVLFSSVASVLGSPGQSNYSAANAFLDGMAQFRSLHGLPALCMNWGAWSETGAALRRGIVESKFGLRRDGLRGISTRDGLQALETLMDGARAQAICASVDWNAYFAADIGNAARPLLRDLQATRPAMPVPIPSAPKENSSWLPQLEAAVPVRRHDLLMRLLAERVQSTLGLGSAQEIDPNQPLQELGLDSLLSIELRNSLTTCLGRNLPATLLFNYPTLNALAGFISREALIDAQPAAEDKAASSGASLVDDIEALSDEEVDRLLSARAMGGVQ